MKTNGISWLLALACGAALACLPSGDDPANSGEFGETTDTSDTDGHTTGDTSAVPDIPSTGMGDPNEQLPPLDEDGCPGIYAQDLFPTFELEIEPVVLELLIYEWNNGLAIENMGMDPKPYHPLRAFRYGEILIEDAEIRLRGNTTWWKPTDKMQFQIGFHRNDPDGRFLGQARLLFDAATFNRHMLRDRLGLSIMRDVGIPAPCANSARVVINGEFYGVFTSIEKIDEVFLERQFDNPNGDLWKRANWTLKSNEDSATAARLNALKASANADELHEYYDIERNLRVFAAEAVIPDSDGAWAGGLNYYLYDDPTTGKFLLLPWDLDNSFERFDHPPGGEYAPNPDPVVWEKNNTNGRPQYDLMMQDPEWMALYIDIIDEILHEGYAPSELHERVDTWTAQIKEAVFMDTNKPYSNALYLEKVGALHAYIDGRYEFLEQWLECWEAGGEADDDGYCELP